VTDALEERIEADLDGAGQQPAAELSVRSRSPAGTAAERLSLRLPRRKQLAPGRAVLRLPPACPGVRHRSRERAGTERRILVARSRAAPAHPSMATVAPETTATAAGHREGPHPRASRRPASHTEHQQASDFDSVALALPLAHRRHGRPSTRGRVGHPWEQRPGRASSETGRAGGRHWSVSTLSAAPFCDPSGCRAWSRPQRAVIPACGWFSPARRGSCSLTRDRAIAGAGAGARRPGSLSRAARWVSTVSNGTVVRIDQVEDGHAGHRGGRRASAIPSGGTAWVVD
jgi:hypothetical protein